MTSKPISVKGTHPIIVPAQDERAGTVPAAVTARMKCMPWEILGFLVAVWVEGCVCVCVRERINH